MWTKSADAACRGACASKSRLLLVFAPSVRHSDYKKQMRAIMGEATGIADRDLVIGELLEKGMSRIGDVPIDPVSAALMRGNFCIDSGDFVVVLIGKDGTERMWSEWPVPAHELFSLIDTMPLRQRELEERSAGG